MYVRITEISENTAKNANASLMPCSDFIDYPPTILVIPVYIYMLSTMLLRELNLYLILQADWQENLDGDCD